MAEVTIQELRDFLARHQGKEVSYRYIRDEMHMTPHGTSWENLRKNMERLASERLVRAVTKRPGLFKVVTQVEPVSVYGQDRPRIPPFELMFPRDFDTGMEMDFVENIVLRQGDLVLIAGQSNQGKTTLALNFCAENIDLQPVLMGNEYTTQVEDKDTGEMVYVPSQRLLNRLDSMSWVQWCNGSGADKFTLLPVHDDYPDHIVRDRINIIDWLDMKEGEHFLVGQVLRQIKEELGTGIAIVAVQKGEGLSAGRGGQFTKDYTDLEILIDRMGEYEVLLQVGKVKEPRGSVMGRRYAYEIVDGVKIINFREVIFCPGCNGKGWTKQGECDNCLGKKYVNQSKDLDGLF